MRLRYYGLLTANDQVVTVTTQMELSTLINHGALSYFLVLKHDSEYCTEIDIHRVFGCCKQQALDFAFLVPRRVPPTYGLRMDDRLESFVCAVPRVFEKGAVSTFNVDSIYDVFSRVVDISMPRVMAYALGECPDRPVAATVTSGRRVDWVVPHKGSARYLRECLKFIYSATDGRNGSVRIGIDDIPHPKYEEIFKGEKKVEGYYSRVPLGGPYVLRNDLVALSDCDFICFQDSDDFPCANRLEGLLAGFRKSDIGIVGSHEIRVEETSKKIFAVRYPLDVSGALRLLAQGAQLHPSTIVRREAFLEAGGFSTHSRFAMDTQFLMRSFFLFRSVNVDAFLYIRRNRADSLTMSTETGMRSLARSKLTRPWMPDFHAVLLGAKRLEETSLALRNVEGSSSDLTRIATAK